MEEDEKQWVKSLNRALSDVQYERSSLLNVIHNLLSRTQFHKETGNVIVEAGFYNDLRDLYIKYTGDSKDAGQSY